MTILVAIDPGAKHLGWARFVDGVLSTCGLSKASMPGAHADNVCEGSKHDRPDVVIVEQMSPRDLPNEADLLRVTETGCYVAGTLQPSTFRLVPARTWKGSVPKDIHHRRVRAKLSPVELARLERGLEGVAPRLQHNVLDAVGIGLYAVGRKA